MSDTKQSIFRPDALRHYTASREQAILLRFTDPRLFLFLWALAGLLVAGVLVAWSARVPVYASGTGIAVVRDGGAQPPQPQIDLIVFLPSEQLSRLSVGQAASIQLGPGSMQSSGTVIAVEPAVISPDDVRRRYPLGSSLPTLIAQPSAVVIVRLPTLPSRPPAESYAGSIYPVDIAIGSHRVLSLVPVLGRLFGEQL